MIKLFYSLAACTIVVLTGCSSTQQSLQDTHAAAKYFKDDMDFTVNPSSMKKAVKNRDKSILIVDLRKREHFEKGHVPGAINLPFDEWNGFDGSKTEFTHLSPSKLHYVYCYEQHCDLSRKAAYLFAKKGFAVKEVKGGFKTYTDHNYPIEK